MAVFALYNVKGGVGKTASAVNLAYLSAQSGVRTVLWDLDPQGAATFYLSAEATRKGARKLLRGKRKLTACIEATDYEGLDLVPASFSFRNLDVVLEQGKKPTRQLGRLLKPLLEDYGHVFLDCPPSMSLTAENVFAAADVLLIPALPTTLSLRTCELIRDHLADWGKKAPRIIPFFCMVDRRKRLHRDVCSAMCQGQYGFASTVIPGASVVEKMGLEQAPLFCYGAKTQAAQAYRELWSEIKALVGK